MNYKSLKIVALAGLLTLVEGKTNQGAISGIDSRDRVSTEIMEDTYRINAPRDVASNIDAILDTLNIPSEVITKDFLKTKIFMHSQNKEYNPLYATIDSVVDTLNVDSTIVNKNFVKTYFRSVNEEESFYNERQVKVRTILDTLTLGSDIIDRKFRKAISKIETEYGLLNESPVGAIGPMQVMPKTWSHYSKKSFKKYSSVPTENIVVGVKYLLRVENMFSYDKNLERYKGKWNTLPINTKEELLAASYNGGYGLLEKKNFNPLRMYKETVAYLGKFKDAKLLISIEDVFDFKQFPDTVYSNNDRVKDLTNHLLFIENYLSKNYSKWKKLDEETRADMIIAASVLGPRRLVDKLKGNHKKDWDFRKMSKHIYSRVNSFNERQELLTRNNKWDYSNHSNMATYMVDKRVLSGLEELVSIEKKLSEMGGWNLLTLDTKRDLVLVASVYGVDNLLKNNLPIGAKELLADANKVFERYSITSRHEMLMNQLFAYWSPK